MTSPCCHKSSDVLFHEFPRPLQLLRLHADRLRELYGVQPILRGAVASLDVDVSGLVGFVAVEEEPKSFCAKNGRHGSNLRLVPEAVTQHPPNVRACWPFHAARGNEALPETRSVD